MPICELAKRYAKALFDLAQQSNEAEKVESDLVELRKLLSESVNLREAVQNPVISKLEQKSAMEFILKKNKVAILTNRLVFVLIDNGRLSYLAEVADAYVERMKQYRDEVVAKVVSASPLGEKQLQDIQQQLSQALGKKVQVDPSVDPDILGGVVVLIGSKMLDGSIAGGLEELQRLSKQAIAS